MMRPAKPCEIATVTPFKSVSHEEMRAKASWYDSPSGARKNQSDALQPSSRPGQPASMSIRVKPSPRADADFANTRFNHRSGIDEIANYFCCFARAPQGTDVQGNVAPLQDYRKKATGIFRLLPTARCKGGVQLSLISPLCIPFRFTVSQKIYLASHSSAPGLHLLVIMISAERVPKALLARSPAFALDLRAPARCRYLSAPEKPDADDR
jgi:hypothetical protein